MGRISQYIKWLNTIRHYLWVKIISPILAFVGLYDLALSQLIPEKTSESFPKIWGIAIMSGNLIPLWGWLLIFAGIVVIASVEYTIHLSKQIPKEEKQEAQEERSKIMVGRSYQYDYIPREGYLNIRQIGDQVSQILDGKTLIIKWGIMSKDLLHIVKERQITAYTPDKDSNIIANQTESDFDQMIGCYAQNNEIDEDVVLRFRFKPEDIREFERHNELMKHAPILDAMKKFRKKKGNSRKKLK